MATVVALVAVAVLLCASLAFAFIGDHMAGMDHEALFCCFVLTLVLSLFVFLRPQRTVSTQDESPRDRLWPLRETAVPPWPPDLVAFGSLLI